MWAQALERLGNPDTMRKLDSSLRTTGPVRVFSFFPCALAQCTHNAFTHCVQHTKYACKMLALVRVRTPVCTKSFHCIYSKGVMYLPFYATLCCQMLLKGARIQVVVERARNLDVSSLKKTSSYFCVVQLRESQVRRTHSNHHRENILQ
jgi:hypothetical protein